MTAHRFDDMTPRPEAAKKPSSAALPRRSAFRMVWLVLGVLSLCLGAIGILLPLLPTTPFVIFAAFCFAKSSAALAERLNSSRVFGPIIADWRSSGAIAPRYKMIAIVMMGGAISFSFAIAVPVTVLVVQALCMTAAASFILSRPNGAQG